MEKTLQLNVGSIPKSVRAKQTIAAVLMMILLVLVYTPFLEGIIQELLGIEYFVDSTMQVSLGYRLYELILSVGLEIISFIVLLTIASNKATQMATLLYVVALVIGYIEYRVGVSAGWILRVVVSLLNVYALSIIITNNERVINIKDKVWLSLFCVHPVMGIMSRITDYITTTHQIESNLYWYLPYQLGGHHSYLNIGTMVWYIIWGILLIISIFRLARCGAFNGTNTNEEQPQANYSPLNRYMVGVVVGCVVGAVLLAIIYGNVNAINEIG